MQLDVENVLLSPYGSGGIIDPDTFHVLHVPGCLRRSECNVHIPMFGSLPVPNHIPGVQAFLQECYEDVFIPDLSPPRPGQGDGDSLFVQRFAETLTIVQVYMSYLLLRGTVAGPGKNCCWVWVSPEEVGRRT